MELGIYPRESDLFIMSQSLSVKASLYIHLHDINFFFMINKISYYFITSLHEKTPDNA